VPAAVPAREAAMTQQAVTVLVPEHPAAGEKPARDQHYVLDPAHTTKGMTAP